VGSYQVPTKLVVDVVIAVNVLQDPLQVSVCEIGLTVIEGVTVFCMIVIVAEATQRPLAGSLPYTVKIFEPPGAPTVIEELFGLTAVPVVVILDHV
jgi:hypothetical protein